MRPNGIIMNTQRRTNRGAGAGWEYEIYSGARRLGCGCGERNNSDIPSRIDFHAGTIPSESSREYKAEREIL